MKIKNFIVVASSLLIVGCGSGGGGLNDIFDDGGSSNFTTATVQINNTTTRDVYELYFKDAHSSDWGYDMLSSDQYISGNTRVNFSTSLCDRNIDVQAVSFFGDTWLIPDVYIECGDTKTVTLTVN
ncbi:MAG: hypothetical protein JXQ76_10210 [Campylobacterales bacterium]|nr:hypothetical protein [Campylobacterales bacterium]